MLCRREEEALTFSAQAAPNHLRQSAREIYSVFRASRFFLTTEAIRRFLEFPHS